MEKRRLSVTIDADLIEAAVRAVKVGDVDSVSAWVNAAMRKHHENTVRLRALAAAIADYEKEFGVITEEDMRRTEREMKRRTIRTGGGLRAGEPRKRYGR